MTGSRRSFLKQTAWAVLGSLFVPRSYAQSFRYGPNGWRHLASPEVYDWVRRIHLNGGATPSNNTLVAASNFVVGCKADGIWSKIIILNFIAPDSAIAFQTPFLKGPGVDPWPMDATSGLGHILDVNGYRNSGNFMDLGASSPGIWASGGDAGFFCYFSRDRDGGTNAGDIFNGIAGNSADPCFMVGIGYVSMFVRYVLYTFPALGYYSFNRYSGTNQVTYFANSTNAHAAVQSDTTNRGTSMSSDHIVLWQSPLGGGGSGTFQGGVSAIGFSTSLSNSDSAALFARLQTLRTALGGGYI